MAEPALALHGVTVTRGPRAVLDRVSLAADAGELLGVLGPNGAGKSTLLKTIAGLVPRAGGSIAVAGADPASLAPRERARSVAYLPQHSALHAPLPARDVVAQGRFAHAGSLARWSAADRAAIDSALERAGATALRDRPFDELSYGERRRVLLARMLASGARLLLLDEPTAALDVGYVLALHEILRGIARDGACLLVVLHNLDEARALADRIVLLSAGRVAVDAPPADALAPEHLRGVYGVETAPGAPLGYRRVPREEPS